MQSKTDYSMITPKDKALTPVEQAIEALENARADQETLRLIMSKRSTEQELYKVENIALTDAALASLKSIKPRKPVNEECATTPIIGNVRERWDELGYSDPERASERFRDDPWKAWYNGWIEGRWPLMVGSKEDAGSMALRFHEAYERLAPSFGYTTRTETRAFDPESSNGKLMIAVCDEILQSAKP